MKKSFVWGDYVKIFKLYQFWISLLFGMSIFAVTFPFYHDMYISALHTILCIFLNAFSCILFSIFLFCKWTNSIDFEGRMTFLWLTLAQTIGHAVFAVMNWGSYLFLLFSIIVLIIIVISFLKDKRR